MQFNVGDIVRVVIPAADAGGRDIPPLGTVFTISEVHPGNYHCPDTMIALEGGGIYYAWRFESV